MDAEPDERQSSALPRNPNPNPNQSGKACTNCARVKSKCIPRANGTSCERCHRLTKTCVAAAPAKQRGPKRGAASRSARLEKKLDDLVSLLRTRQLDQDDHGGLDSGNDGLELDDGVNSPSTSLLSTPSTGEDDSCEPSLVEADDSLQRFREEMILFTPYVYLPAEMTSVQIRQTYPFFWLNIMGVASKSTKRRNSLSFQARRVMIERVVAGGERSLDLLFGILTFVNWVHLFPMDKQFASLASQLAVALVWDLGLQMPPAEHPTRFPPVQVAYVAQQSIGKERTIEEKRAVLGAFVITSMVSQTFKVADGLRWSPYLDEYLAHVSHHSTVPQDKILVRQVKMQLIVNQVRYSSWKMSNIEIPTAWVDVLQSRLDELISTMDGTSLAFGSESTMLGFYHYTTLTIREWIMFKSPIPQNEPDLRRYELYQRCANSVKAWLDIFFSMPLHAYTSVSCSTYSQLCYVVVFLHQITTTKDANWNPGAAQEVVNPLQIVDRIIHTFEQVKAVSVTHTPGGGEDQALCLGIRKFQALKTAWQSELGPKGRDQGAIQETETPDTSQGLFATESMNFYSFHMLPNTLDSIPW